VTDVAVSAMIAPGESRFSALRSFELWACNAAAGSDCSKDAGFTKVYTSSPDAFPGDAPRPNGPQLILRDFSVPSFRATHVRLRVVASQCTGGPAYQGKQDADPGNATDCDTNVASNSSRRFVRTAEIQVFTSSPTG
jgi:extracellular elastinolytic metalloproteinase